MRLLGIPFGRGKKDAPAANGMPGLSQPTRKTPAIMELCEVTADELESPFRQDSYHEVKYVCTDRGTSSESTSSEIFAPGRDPRRRSFGVTLKPLHRGRHAELFLSLSQATNEPLVLKSYKKASMTEARRAVMQREVSVMTHLKGSPFMVELQCVEDDEMYHYLVMAKCPGRTLLELMAEGGGRVLEARLASDVVPSLLGALVLTHRRRVVHSDLRPEHIICQRGCVKLLDWASAVDMSLENAVARGTGAVAYMAPEVANKPSLADAFHMVIDNGMSEDELPRYDEKADIWSLGVTLFEALSGRQPFVADTAAEVLEAQGAKLGAVGGSADGSAATAAGESGPVPEFIACLPVSQGAKSFLAACLQRDPAQRPSAEQLLDHAWLPDAKRRSIAVSVQRGSTSSNGASERRSMQQLRLSASNPAAAAACASKGSGITEESYATPRSSMGDGALTISCP